jgi:hypothetical protein
VNPSAPRCCILVLKQSSFSIYSSKFLINGEEFSLVALGGIWKLTKLEGKGNGPRSQIAEGKTIPREPGCLKSDINSIHN